jgi:large subunit ribosomal protein L19
MSFSILRRGFATSTRACAAPAAFNASKASSSAAYTFAAQAKADNTARNLDPALKLGKGLMAHLQRTLPAADKQALLAKFLARDGPNSERILPGSVLTIHSDQSPTTFSGVLVGVRRRGPDTSIVLRNVIQRTGVEIRYFVNSPHVKKIDVVRNGGPAGGAKKGRRTRRAKVTYIRHSSEKMSAMAGS